MALYTFLALVSVIISLAYFWIRKRYSYFEDNGFLFEKPSFPFGNLQGVGRKIHMVYRVTELYEKFKGKAPAFGIYFFAAPNVIITDLETIKSVLVKDFDTFHNRGVYNNTKDDPLTGHLFTIEDDAWRNMRAKLTPTFTSGKMKMMFGTVVDIADIMLEQLKQEPNLNMIEMKDVLGKFTTDVIGNVAFGLDMNSIKDPDAKFRQMGKKIFKQDANFLMKVLFFSSFKTLARKLHMTVFPKDLSEFFLSTIRDTVEYRRTNKIERTDVMDLLLKIKGADGKDGGLTLNELAAQCFIFFIAGKIHNN